MQALPKYVMRDTDRHGNVRHYYRRDGRKIRLAEAPGSVEFSAEYALAGAAFTDKGRVRQAPPSHVYFILYGPRRVKIGVSRAPLYRLQSLKAGIPGRARVYYSTPGDAKLERRLHQIFAEDKINGEWFQYSAAIREWIAEDETRRALERGVPERKTNRSSPTDLPHQKTG